MEPDYYVYCADVYCNDCAENIISDLDDGDQEDTGDTDDYPQPVFYAEADSPQHCAECREFLQNHLTTDGIDYLYERIITASVISIEAIPEEWRECYELPLEGIIEHEGLACAATVPAVLYLETCPA